jgi:hypothetical protein
MTTTSSATPRSGTSSIAARWPTDSTASPPQLYSMSARISSTSTVIADRWKTTGRPIIEHSRNVANRM